MAERIDEAALPVSSPRHWMVPDGIETTVRACLHRARNERVGIVGEDLYPCRGRTQLHRSFPTVVLRFAESIGAPSISIPTTDPRFQSSVTPSACLYHARAAGASATASMTVINDWCLNVTITSTENGRVAHPLTFTFHSNSVLGLVDAGDRTGRETRGQAPG